MHFFHAEFGWFYGGHLKKSEYKSIFVKHQTWLFFSAFNDLFPTHHKVAHSGESPNFYVLFFNKTQPKILGTF